MNSGYPLLEALSKVYLPSQPEADVLICQDYRNSKKMRSHNDEYCTNYTLYVVLV